MNSLPDVGQEISSIGNFLSVFPFGVYCRFRISGADGWQSEKRHPHHNANVCDGRIKKLTVGMNVLFEGNKMTMKDGISTRTPVKQMGTLRELDKLCLLQTGEISEVLNYRRDLA